MGTRELKINGMLHMAQWHSFSFVSGSPISCVSGLIWCIKLIIWQIVLVDAFDLEITAKNN